ncbi:conserved hypothetical protein [Paraburkholderia sacchari]|uniref:TglA family RiPP precursor n=1 Tax=Paraburkholderia sacchari TaxID=159450 RepID=UPI0039A74489
MSNLSNDSVVPGAADSALEPQVEGAQPAAAQCGVADLGSIALEDFNLDDIEVIESKVFA